MSEPVKLSRRIALKGQAIVREGLTIQPVPEIGKILLQRSNCVADREMEILGQKFAHEFGPDLPMPVCGKAMSRDGAVTLLCLNPTSWIILSDQQDAGTITEWFDDAAQGATITATEVTDQYICLDIAGRHARTLLAKGCALDLTEDVFHDDCVARTLLAQANVVIWRLAEGDYRILFDVSLRDYLWLWLEGASAEFARE